MTMEEDGATMANAEDSEAAEADAGSETAGEAEDCRVKEADGVETGGLSCFQIDGAHLLGLQDLEVISEAMLESSRDSDRSSSEALSAVATLSCKAWISGLSLRFTSSSIAAMRRFHSS
jgi:hypothetical protein